MTRPHQAIGLIRDEQLRQEVAHLLPAYEFTWELALHDSVRQAADLRASFLLADIHDPNTNWKAIAIALQNSPATRRLPMVGIAESTNDDTMALADSASIYGPISRARLGELLPDWVARHARIWGQDYYTAIEQGCAGTLPPQAQHGIELFNQHEFWEAHEALEELWQEIRPNPLGEVYRSILQVGVAYHHIQNQNYRGATKLFLRAVQWLDPLPNQCHGINLAQFKGDVAEVRAVLEQLGPDRIQEFDLGRLKPIPMVED